MTKSPGKYAYPDNSLFVTFYSYKGGVGRSMALANAAVLIAAAGRRVLMVDGDLEAPGLSALFEMPDIERQPGLVEYIQKLKNQLPTTTTPGGRTIVDKQAAREFLEKPDGLARPDFKRFIQSVTIEKFCKPKVKGECRLDLMPSGAMDGDHCARIEHLAIREMYEQEYGLPLVRRLKEFIAEQKYHCVLIDARTGLSEMGIVATYDLADSFVFLSGLNDQNLKGMRIMLDSLEQCDASGAFAQRPKIFVASPVPLSEEDLKIERLKQFEYVIKHKPHLLLTYHPRIALKEEIFSKRYPGHPLSAEYNKLAEMIRFLAGDSFERLWEQAEEARKNNEFDTELEYMKQAYSCDSRRAFVAIRSRLTDSSNLPLETGKRFFEFLISISAERDWRTRDIYADFLLAQARSEPYEVKKKLVDQLLSLYKDFLQKHDVKEPLFFDYFGIALCESGEMLRDVTLLRQACEQHEKAILLDDKNPGIYSNYGNALQVLGRQNCDAAMLRCACEQQEKAILLDDRNPGIYSNYGNALQELGKLESDAAMLRRGCEQHEKAIALDDKNPVIYSNYGNALQELGILERDAAMLRRACEQCEKAITLDDKNPLYYSKHGNALGELGKLERDAAMLRRACEQCEKAITLDDKNPLYYSKHSAALLFLWYVVSDSTFLKTAIAQCEKAERLMPGSGSYNMACAFALMKDRDKALEWLEKALEHEASAKKEAKEDEDLKSLWDDPEFKRIVQE